MVGLTFQRGSMICPSALGDCECVRNNGHRGLHMGIYDWHGRLVDVGWADGYPGLAEQVWFNEVRPDSDEPLPMPAVYAAENSEWMVC